MKHLLQLLVAVLLTVGCSTTTEPTPTDPTDELVLIGTDTVNTHEVSLYFETAPHVGMNTVLIRVVQLPQKTTVETVIWKIDPTMPSMGHGSPGNVHPVHHGNGWYRGTCNFTMTGDWDIALTRMDHDTIVHTTHFPVVVK